MRVGAILSADSEKVRFFGYGEYAGDFIPPESAGGMSDFCRALSRPNPKIVLDDGKVVWGCECWWSPESEVKEQIAAYEASGIPIEMVDIDLVRTEDQ